MIISHQHFDLNGKIVLERLVFKTPLTNQASMHDEACLLYNIKGDVKLYSALNKEMLSDNECVIMKCGQYFTTHPLNPNQTPSDVVAVHFHPDILKLVFENDLPSHLLETARHADKPEINRIAVDAILQNYIQGLLLLFENPTLVSDELIVHKLKDLLLMLLSSNSEESQKIKTILSDIFNPTQTSFREIIKAHCYDNLTTNQLAFLCNMSLSTFKRRFRETYNQNPAAYIRKKKLEKAAQLLKTSDESVSSICYDSGFSDTSNFTKIFSAHFQCTPSQYRKQNH